jgi:hypothetical protein
MWRTGIVRNYPFLVSLTGASFPVFWLFAVVSDFMRQTDGPAFSRLGALYPSCLVFKVFWRPGAKPTEYIEGLCSVHIGRMLSKMCRMPIVSHFMRHFLCAGSKALQSRPFRRQPKTTRYTCSRTRSSARCMGRGSPSSLRI